MKIADDNIILYRIDDSHPPHTRLLHSLQCLPFDLQVHTIYKYRPSKFIFWVITATYI